MTVQPLIDLARTRHGLGPDDLLACLGPLFRQVIDLHTDGLVAPLRGIEALQEDDQYRVSFDPALAYPRREAPARVDAVQRRSTGAVEVVSRSRVTHTAGERSEIQSLDVVHPHPGLPGRPDPGPPAVDRPVLVSGWQTWEHLIGHQDELTDLASLGLLLVALACGLDLADPADAENLARHRGNLFAIKPDLHPVIALLAEQMIDPDRHSRLQDLPSALQRLQSYRDQPLDFSLDLLSGELEAEAPQYRQLVLETLRDRLFDLSRRNRLLHFRSTQQSLNLTEASVPLLLDARNIQAGQLCTWSPPIARRVLRGKGLTLGSVIRWDDAPYAAGVLDGLISQARRDRSEYGQSQLRLVIAFLRWHDLKTAPEERIASPLLLLPAELTKRRGVRDSYQLLATDSVAEVNPALRQQLERLYGIELPETVDLADDAAVGQLHTVLAGQIAAGEPGVRLSIRDRPRIELIHQRAQLRFDAYQRRTGRARTALGGRSYAYSYRRRDYRPLGLQIFRDRVAVRPAPMSMLLGDPPAPRIPQISAPEVGLATPPAVERETYALDQGTDGNPYAWEIDLCAVTLANLNYRTMSLVRDYQELIAGTGRDPACTAFDRVFSAEPRPIDGAQRPHLALADRHLVVPADGSQVAAVARARDGESFVIQGPPGTGKSQTITNLIADYVARGRRVLFVCQKRAAIDVVHARLQAQGLDELTCLIHDSQADKKQFVMGLKHSYEAWLETGDDVTRAEQRREQAISMVEAALGEVERYEGVLAEADGLGPSLRTQLERLIELSGQRWGDELPASVRRWLPTPGAWWAARPAVDAVAAALIAAGQSPVLADSPLRFLAPAVLSTARPAAEVMHRAASAANTVHQLISRLDDAAGGADLNLESAAKVVELAQFLAPLARRRRAGVLRGHSAAAEDLERDVAAWQRRHDAHTQAFRAAQGWVAKPSPVEARAALEVARKREGTFLRALHGDWRQVRRMVAGGYQPPTSQATIGSSDSPVAAGGLAPSQALALLVAAQQADAELSTARTEFEQSWGHSDPEALLDLVTRARSNSDPGVVRWREKISGSASGSEAELSSQVEQLADTKSLFEEVRAALDGLLVDIDHLQLTAKKASPQDNSNDLAPDPEAAASLSGVLAALSDPETAATVHGLGRALLAMPEHPAVMSALRRLPATPDGIEYAICAAALAEASAADHEFARFDGTHLATLIDRIQRVQPDLLAAEAGLLVSRVRSAFLTEARHAGESLTGMSPADRQRKQVWTAGRRVLEHEFGKVQRYRSIRELASGDSGTVVAALRPVWLMSPTSVSDTLPLDPTLFDVVIYDEASQIPVEEAVPAMHRGSQVIVVGDRMQLPPTQYFSTGAGAPTSALDATGNGRSSPGEPSDEVDEPADEDEIPVVLDGDSFLAQSAVRLPSTMLSWHYRSRFEALIAFSNTMFYDGRLAVVPDRAPAVPGRPDIVVDVGEQAVPEISRADAAAGVDALLERSISLHQTPGSVYRRRANPGEAVYVAELVREFLRRETGLTLGIVAFSQAQQGEIERALERLAGTDDLFARRYEDELARKDGEQAVGLFVKNLENVQGDERDVMIMSICYAPGESGRMLMNFGPINQKGGEKRLNVIVSRARQHMAVVSSIEAEAITNTYNDGANTLRRFLGYARAVSRGDTAAAVAALGRSGPVPSLGRSADRVSGSSQQGEAAGAALATALRARGLVVAENLGQSAFRCDLALRRPEDQQYRVAVLLDTSARVAAQPLGERLTSNPAVLTNAGWQVVPVLLKDWHDGPDRVISALLAQVLETGTGNPPIDDEATDETARDETGRDETSTAGSGDDGSAR